MKYVRYVGPTVAPFEGNEGDAKKAEHGKLLPTRVQQLPTTVQQLPTAIA